MTDYRKLERAHKLSSYEVRMPFWMGSTNIRKPFAAWARASSLSWYQAYNRAKHDRHNHFLDATLTNAIDAICGLVAIISAQFIQEDFSQVFTHVIGTADDYFKPAVGWYFQVHFPDDWPEAEKYQFEWSQIEDEADPFAKFPF